MSDPKKECVGSLLVPKKDLQELSSSSDNNNNNGGGAQLQKRFTETADFVKNELKRDECVGTMLVHTSDMKEFSEKAKGAGSSLVKRATNHLNHLPAPTAEDVQTILDDV